MHIALLAFAIALQAHNQSDKPLLVLTGADSHISQPTVLRADSADQWQQIWIKHLGVTPQTIHRPAMEIDFGKCTLLAIFKGATANRTGVRVVSIDELPDALQIRLEDISYQTLSSGKDGGIEHVTPFAFVLIPRTSKLLVIEENVQGYKDRSAEWKQIAKLKAS